MVVLEIDDVFHARSIEFVGQLSLCDSKSGPNAAHESFVQFQTMGDHACRYRHDNGELFPFLGRVVRPLYDDHIASKMQRSKGHVDPQGVGSIRAYTTSEIMMLVFRRFLQQTPAQRKSLSVRLTLVDHCPHYDHERRHDRAFLGSTIFWGLRPWRCRATPRHALARGQRRWRL